MGLENPTGATISTFDPTWPTDGDPINQGDDHIRLIKAVLKSIFPGVGGNGFATPISAVEAELNFVSGVTSAIQDQINSAVASIQNAAMQTNVAFATTGGAGAYALTTTPVIALSTNLRYRVSFNAISIGTDTLSVNSSTPIIIKQYASDGSLDPAIIRAGMLADVEYNGTYWIILDPLPPSMYQTGDVKWFSYSPIPSDWLAFATAAGGAQLQLISSYPALAALLGTAWGGNGITTFGIPWCVPGGVPLHMSGLVGSQSTGQVKDHGHSFGVTDQLAGGGGGGDANGGVTTKYTGGALDLTSHASIGGANNLAAGAVGIWAIKT